MDEKKHTATTWLAVAWQCPKCTSGLAQCPRTRNREYAASRPSAKSHKGVGLLSGKRLLVIEAGREDRYDILGTFAT